jgi:hypothetical protein
VPIGPLYPNQFAAGVKSGDFVRVRRCRRREVTHLKLENDILKKAAVILGTKPHVQLAR